MIPNEFLNTIKLIREFNELLFSLFGTDITPEEEETINFITNKKTSNLWKDDIAESFQKEYESLNEKNHFFIGCKFDVYVFNYEKRLENYLKKSNELKEENFIEQELKSIGSYIISDYASEQLKEIIRASLTRETMFLEERLNELGLTAIFDRETSMLLKLSPIANNTIINFLDDDASLKISQKIIYLHELGILDFLREKQPFTSSINSLAEILSLILGENQTTLQSYLNPIFSSNTLQSNNPLNNRKALSKVKTHLAEIGFKTNK